jgi:hypothetical protein
MFLAATHFDFFPSHQKKPQLNDSIFSLQKFTGSTTWNETHNTPIGHEE